MQSQSVDAPQNKNNIVLAHHEINNHALMHNINKKTSVDAPYNCYPFGSSADPMNKMKLRTCDG